MQAQLKTLQCPHAGGSHRVAYWEWGPTHHPHVVVCVHGLSRQGRDFDVLAQRLVGPDGQRCRVVCPDMAGRGHSDWLANPALYGIAQYAADMLQLIAVLKPTTLDWIGTSMGGLIGMAVAGQGAAAPASTGATPPALPALPTIGKLLLNDVGPAVQWAALQRICTYLGKDLRFDSEQSAVDYLWSISSTFGPHTPAQWLALSQPMLRALPQPDGSNHYKLHYDPAIAIPVRAATPEQAAQGEAMLWQLYDNIRCATLVTRGAQSDLLSPETLLAMQNRGPRARRAEFEGVGHAPTFVANNQVDTAENFIFPA